MKPGGWGVIMCVVFAKSHIIMVISPNVSVTRMKILAVVSEISHIGSYLTCLGPRSYVSVSALTVGQINRANAWSTSAARDLCQIPLLFWHKLHGVSGHPLPSRGARILDVVRPRRRCSNWGLIRQCSKVHRPIDWPAV
jgi:hypothetical protein